MWIIYEMRKWIIIILFAFTIALVSSVPTLIVHVQDKGVYTQDRVVYTFVAYETHGISASDYVFPVAINTNFPAFHFFKNHDIYVASDPDCSFPVKYWVQYVSDTEVLIWVHVDTMNASASTTFYVCASTSNPDPASGDPEINHMFMMFDNFDGNGYISWSFGGPGMVGNTVDPTTYVNNGILTMIFRGKSLTEAGLVAGSVDIANTPYFIVLARMSATGGTGPGVVGGIYVNMSNFWVSLYVGNAYIEYTDPSYNGIYMFFSSSEFWSVTYTYPRYVATTLSNWVVMAEWNFYGNYPAVYPAVYDDYMNIISYTSASLYYTGTSPRVGLFQLRWDDGIARRKKNTIYVDWFAVIQYWGFPSLTYLGATVHETLHG